MSTIVSDNLPVVDQEKLDKIFRRLSVMTVELYENPLEYGPAPLANKVVEARTYLDETEDIFLNVSHWIQKYTAAHRAAQLAMNLGIDHLLANDPETRAGRNLETQKAIAKVKLRHEVEEVNRISAVLEDLKAVLQVVKAKRTDLKDTQQRLRDIQNLCKELIGLGGRWGSKPLPGTEAPDLDAAPEVDKTSLRELQQMFEGQRVSEEQVAEVASEVVVQAPAAPEPVAPASESDAELAAPVDSDEEVDNLLKDFPDEEPKSTKLDVDSLLQDFGL